MGQVEAVEFGIFDLQGLHHAQALAAASEATGVPHQLVKGGFHRVTERRVTQIAAQGDGFRQILVQAQGTGQGAGNGGYFNGVSEAGADIVP